jgi:hypothetical protein
MEISLLDTESILQALYNQIVFENNEFHLHYKVTGILVTVYG